MRLLTADGSAGAGTRPGPRLAILSVALALALALAGCGPARISPVASPPVHFADLSVPQALTWFRERTMTCLGPDIPDASVREWRCLLEGTGVPTAEVRITGDAAGVVELVAVVSDADDPEESASFLLVTVAGAATSNEARDELALWAIQHALSGGQVVLSGRALVLQPHSARRAVVVHPS
jgi:hypothetical protein